jgi:hypothetical protein
VLPEYARYAFQRRFDGSEERTLDAIDDIVAAKPFFELHVVRMSEQGDTTGELESDHGYLISEMKEIGVCRVHLAFFDDQGKWNLAPEPYVGKYGQFVGTEEENMSLDPLDVLPHIGRILDGKWL